MDKEKMVKTVSMWIATVISWVFFLAFVLGGVWLVIYLVKRIVGLF